MASNSAQRMYVWPSVPLQKDGEQETLGTVKGESGAVGKIPLPGRPCEASVPISSEEKRPPAFPT